MLTGKRNHRPLRPAIPWRIRQPRRDARRYRCLHPGWAPRRTL